jgi:hypothetical protein
MKNTLLRKTTRDPLDMGLQQVFCGPSCLATGPLDVLIYVLFFSIFSFFFGVYGFIDTTIDHLFADISLFSCIYTYIPGHTSIRYNLQPSLVSQCAPPVAVELITHLQPRDSTWQDLLRMHARS